MIDYQPLNSFIAKGIYHFAHHEVSVQMTGHYKSNSAEPVLITMWSDNEKAAEVFDASMRLPYAVWFEGVTVTGESIWIMGINPHKIIGFTRLEGDADIFLIGDYNKTISPDQKVYIRTNVSPTPVLLSEWIYSQNEDGTISTIGDDDKKREGIRWTNSHGEVQFIHNYEYTDETRNNQPIILQIQNNSLLIRYTPNTSSDIKSILYQLPDFLADDLQLLSFIGRQRVVCFEATTRLENDEDESVFCRYRSWSGFHNLPSDQSILRTLILPKKLQEGLFSQILVNFKSSPFKPIIVRTIPLLVTSYEDGYVETQLVNAYAALESMVDGIGDALNYTNLLDNAPFKKLSNKVKETIEGEVNDPDVREGIIKKIPELRRRSFLDRLLYLVDIQKVNSQLIWPPNTDQPTELHELLKRRNLLIHTGASGQGGFLLYDLNRVQKLVELWILKLIDCPEDAINQHGLWRGAPINKILHP